MNNIGMNATIITEGPPKATNAATAPSVAARLYAGAVDATPITMFDRNVIAFCLSCGRSTSTIGTSRALLSTNPPGLTGWAILWPEAHRVKTARAPFAFRIGEMEGSARGGRPRPGRLRPRALAACHLVDSMG